MLADPPGFADDTLGLAPAAGPDLSTGIIEPAAFTEPGRNESWQGGPLAELTEAAPKVDVIGFPEARDDLGWEDEEARKFVLAVGEGPADDRLDQAERRRRQRRRRVVLTLVLLFVGGPAAAAAMIAQPTESLAVEVLPPTGGEPGKVRLTGWLDEGPGGEAPQLRIDVDGRPADRSVANGRSRQRWEWRGPRDERGFGLTVTVPPGEHEVCIIAADTERVLQCTKVTVPGPTGSTTTGTGPDGSPAPSGSAPATVPAASPDTSAPAPPTTQPPAPVPPPAAPSTKPPATTPAAPPSTTPPPPSWQADLLAQVNAERAKAGLTPLTACASLDRAAQGYADLMSSRGWFDHNGPDGSTLSSRARAAGYTSAGGAWSVGENIARGQSSVIAVMEGWMNSAGHRANILNAEYRHLGVGRASGNYWVQNFGKGGTC
jgi:uncharacterized protein YkwD